MTMTVLFNLFLAAGAVAALAAVCSIPSRFDRRPRTAEVLEPRLDEELDREAA